MSTIGFSYTLAFLMGLTGSLHCAGMCGPIMWVLPFQHFGGIRKAIAIGAYHLNRITVYAFFGMILHSFKSLFNPVFQQYISIGLGVLLLLVGILTFFPTFIKVNVPWSSYIQKKLGFFVATPKIQALAMAGIMNGLLPCGLVYMALSSSMVASTMLQAGMLMFVFGLGTIPMLVGITILKSKLNFIRIVKFRQFIPIMLFFFGCIFVIRGMNLGIPYLSPKAEITASGIKSCCCHKK